MAQNILISSLDKIPNHTITETKGVIHVSDLTEKKSFDTLKNDLICKAQSLGCNAIINFKWTTTGLLHTTWGSNSITYKLFYDMTGEAVKLVKSKEEKELNEKGLKKESIEIVIERGKCSREHAIKALKECNGDITEALLAIDLNNK